MSQQRSPHLVGAAGVKIGLICLRRRRREELIWRGVTKGDSGGEHGGFV